MSRQFEDFVKRLTPTLRRITHKLNGHFSYFDDDDLFQEALAHLWVSFESGAVNGKTDSYILQGCYFYLKNFLRKRMDKASCISLSHLIAEEDGTLLEECLVCGDSDYDDIEGDLLMEHIKSCGLTDRENTVLALSLDGLTMREIGHRLGISHVMVIKIKKRVESKCRSLKAALKGGYQN